MATMTTPRDAGKGWATGGLLKTTGIPAPSGHYAVGCADIMSAEDGLLVRLYYPTNNQVDGVYQYAPANPDPKYIKALCELYNTKPAWLISAAYGKVIDARIPALSEAPFYKATSANNTTLEDTPSSQGDTPASQEDTPSSQRATPASQGDADDFKFPVIVFSHGLHAHRVAYSGVCCDLVSHGYIVAAVEHKDQSACLTFNRVPGPGVANGDYDRYINEWIPVNNAPTDVFPLRNKQVMQRASEVSKALDLLSTINNNGSSGVNNMMGESFDLNQFMGHIDTDSAVVMGHSFGGATTVVTLATDSRFKCGVAMDTWMYPVADDLLDNGISQPLLFINSFSFQWAENVAKIMKLVKPPDEMGVSKCSLVTLKGTCHFTQCDIGFTLPSFLKKEYYTDNAYEANAVNSQLCHSFFKRYLLQDSAYLGRVPILDGGEGSDDLILYGTNIDWETAKDTKGLESTGTATEGPESTGTATGGPESNGAATGGPESNGAATEGPESNGAATEGPECTGTTTEGPESTSTTTEGPESTGTTTEGTSTATEGPESTSTTTEGPESTSTTTEGPETTSTATEGPECTSTTTEGPETK